MSFKTYHKRFNTRVRRGVANGLDEAGRYLRVKMRQALSVPGPTPSLPGEAPHRQTGAMRKGIKSVVDEKTLTMAVGSDGPDPGLKEAGAPQDYPTELELGSSRVAPRPWLRSTFAAERREAGRRFLAGGKAQ